METQVFRWITCKSNRVSYKELTVQVPGVVNVQLQLLGRKRRRRKRRRKKDDSVHSVSVCISKQDKKNFFHIIDLNIETLNRTDVRLFKITRIRSHSFVMSGTLFLQNNVILFLRCYHLCTCTILLLKYLKIFFQLSFKKKIHFHYPWCEIKM